MKIQKIEAENFKLFSEKFQDVEKIGDTDLILFNGPNGYGKTSVFDVLEFCLTGKIKRILQYTEELKVAKNEASENRILISDETRESHVKIYLEEKGQNIEITYLCPPRRKKNASRENNPIRIFDMFHRTIVCNGEEVQNQEDFLNGLGLNDIEEVFDKCCFLSQDEHLSFLKKAKTSKADALSFLFEVPEIWTKEQERVEKLLDSLCDRRKTKVPSYLIRLAQQEEKIENEKKTLEEKMKTDAADAQVPYQRLFQGKNIAWDQENAVFDEKAWRDAQGELEDLLYFSKNKESCRNYLFNRPYEEFLKEFQGGENIFYQDCPLEYSYRFYGLVKKEEELERAYIKEKKYRGLYDNLQNGKYDGLNWEFIREENLLEYAAVSEIQGQLKVLGNLGKTQGLLERTMLSLSQTRQQLIEHMHTAMEQRGLSENVCPLCGASYTDREALDKEIEKETKVLNELSDDSVTQIRNIRKNLYEEFFRKLMENISERLKNTVSEKTYRRLQEAKRYKLLILKNEEILGNIDIHLPEQYVEDITEQNRGYNALLKELRAKMKAIPEEVSLQLKAREFEEKLKRYFDGDEMRFSQLSVEMLERKKGYINFSYFDANNKLLETKKTELEIVRNRKRKLERLKADLEKYQTALAEGIQEYKKTIMKDIEPLLYVYTARMLQQKFNGKSVCISTDEHFKNIQFINSGNTDKQDILYSMSSGQLSAVALAFLLCMNQVYGQNRACSVLMIDDPVQTIDDVNMVGFVDILRYEFPDRQIFVSTHEQKFEWFLRYRFAKAGKSVKVFNMKDIMLGE